jgi:uncharacterized membrane protein YphA (DoxX/SURF4 family)
MGVGMVILSVLLAAAFAMAGGSKLAGVGQMRDAAAHLGIPYSRYRTIGVLELAAAAGLLMGLVVAALGAAAAIGLVLVMIGALILHRRAHDPPAAMAPATVLLILAIGVVLLRIITA